MNKHNDKDWLYEQYWEKGLSIPEMAEICKVAKTTLVYWMKKHNMSRRSKSECQKGNKAYWHGKKHSNTTKEKMSKSHKGIFLGEKNPMYGKELSTEHREKIANALKEYNEKFGCAMTGRMGDKSNNWQGGKTELSQLIRTSEKYKAWRQSCFERDDYTCQHCFQYGGTLHVDHIKPFALIIKENNIITAYQAGKCQELWKVNNGRTLCKTCHMKTGTHGQGTKQLLDELSARKD